MLAHRIVNWLTLLAVVGLLAWAGVQFHELNQPTAAGIFSREGLENFWSLVIGSIGMAATGALHRLLIWFKGLAGPKPPNATKDPIQVPIQGADLKTDSSESLRDLASRLAQGGKWDEVAEVAVLERKLGEMFK